MKTHFERYILTYGALAIGALLFAGKIAGIA